MRERRYLLTRRKARRFVRVEDSFRPKYMDGLERRVERLERRLGRPSRAWRWVMVITRVERFVSP